MPIYEFKCNECGLRFERLYAETKGEATEECPSCKKAAHKIISRTNHVMKESKVIPKEIDLKVGRDAEKRWLAYEDRKNEKEKIKKETGVNKLSRNAEGKYVPLSVTDKEGKVASEKDAVAFRKKAFKEFDRIKKDPKTTKEAIPDQ